jgi:hypothetical protein
MSYLKARKIAIDVVGDDPFIAIEIDKIITNPDGSIKQTIGGFDRIYERASSIPIQMDYLGVGDDGVIDGIELFTLVANAAYLWIIDKHGGQVINGVLEIDDQ